MSATPRTAAGATQWCTRADDAMSAAAAPAVAAPVMGIPTIPGPAVMLAGASGIGQRERYARAAEH